MVCTTPTKLAHPEGCSIRIAGTAEISWRPPTPPKHGEREMHNFPPTHHPEMYVRERPASWLWPTAPKLASPESPDKLTTSIVMIQGPKSWVLAETCKGLDCLDIIPTQQIHHQINQHNVAVGRSTYHSGWAFLIDPAPMAYYHEYQHLQTDPPSPH